MTVVFQIVLWSLGAVLTVASRLSERVRSQLAREFVVVLESDDGVARSFCFERRRVVSRAGRAQGARCTVRFRTSAIGLTTLLSPDAVDRIYDGLHTGDVECDGQAAYLLWFYQLAIGLVPLGRPQREAWPDSYVAHDPTRRAADRITREPAVAELDPTWTAAHAQRDKLMLWQVGQGGEPSGRFTRHRIVVEGTPGESATPSPDIDGARPAAEPSR